MKIALVTANFPPKICGVGDHSFHLRNSLQALGHSIHVFAKSPSTETLPLEQLWQKSPDDYDLLILQYTPYLYANRWGVSPLPSHLKLWRNKFLFIAHELHYPWQFSLAGTYLSLQHRIQFAKIQRLAKHTVYAYAKPVKNSQSESWLPVGSNITPVNPSPQNSNPSTDPKTEAPREICFLHFGGAHPTHEYPLLNAIVRKLHEEHKISEKIYCLGVTAADLQKFGDLPYLKPLGKRSAAEVSLWLQSAKIVFSPFLDGVSTRRGSFMAALAHGRPVLTNLGSSSNPDIPWSNFSGVCEHSATSIAQQAVHWLQNPKEAEVIGKKGQEHYRNHFDWPVIAKKLSGLF